MASIRFLPLAALVGLLALGACGRATDDPPEESPCADPASSACNACKLKAQVDVCQTSYEDKTVACAPCEADVAGCDEALCRAKRQVFELCWTKAAKQLCGIDIAPGTGGAGGDGGSGGGAGGDGGNAGSGGEGGTAGEGGSGGNGGEGGSGGSGGSGGGGGEGGSGGSGGGGGEGGEGGAGGSGGEGGAGGEGGGEGEGGSGGTVPALCNGQLCGDGEICNRAANPPRCQCASDPDSCEPFGLVCGPNRTCQEPPPPAEFFYCDDSADLALSPDGTLICFPLTSGRKVWVRLCMNGSDECVLRDTVCLDVVTGGNLPICWWNLCGDNNVDDDGEYLNGGPYGACDTVIGEIWPGEPAPTGTCIPEDGGTGPVFICQAEGTSPVGGACRLDATRLTAADACEQGSTCLFSNLRATACTTDAECDPAQECDAGTCTNRLCTVDADCGGGFDRYCYQSLVCLPKGTCYETCNFGNGDMSGEYADCSSLDLGCFAYVDATWPITPGYCTGPICEVFDAGGCAAGEQCWPAGDAKGMPTAGLCIDSSTGTGAAGDSCAAGTGVECGDAMLCLDAGAGATCMPFCECAGAGGWDALGFCMTTPDCGGGGICANLGINDNIGICLLF